GQPAATDISCTSEIPPPEGTAKGLTVFDQTFVKSLRVRNALRVGFKLLADDDGWCGCGA
ncbi:MAG: hypothetical protein U9N61_13180, partial [Euryarchaeota archaeon]|nr:hypothetical protein [Euryarchaeota archaeon]